MAQKIIYQTDDGLKIISPAPGANIQYVAQKDVPPGVDYIIVNDEDLPSDASSRDFWYINESDEVDFDAAAHLIKTQVDARYAIDEAAEHARLRFITNGAGQALVYQEKAFEAERYVTAGYPTPSGSPPSLSEYPFVQAEAEATGKSYAQAANDILIQRAEWVAIGSLIEKHRMMGKTQVNEATDAAVVNALAMTYVNLLNSIAP